MLPHLASLVLAGVATPDLTVSPAFPTPGDDATYTITATPGSAFALYASLVPFEFDLGPIGTLVLDPSKMFPLATGVVPGGGAAEVVLPLPDGASFVGVELHAQAAEVVGPQITLSTGATLRLEDAAPSGSRATISVAATPDGSRVFATNRDDGTVAVIDAATGGVLRELPCGVSALHHVGGPLFAAVDPQGRHAFVLNAADTRITVIHVATEAIVAKLTVPRGCKRVAFDDSGANLRLYVTNEPLDSVLVFDEVFPGLFVQGTPIALEGHRPGPLVLLDDGRLLVANQGSNELEIVDPTTGTTDDSLFLNRMPHDVVVRGGEAWVAAFTRQVTPGPGDGHNHLVRVSLAPALAVVGLALEDEGTDYIDLELAGDLLALVGAGSGSVVFADANTLLPISTVDLAPGQPNATPAAAAFTLDGGTPDTLFVANMFRESVRAIDVSGTPPFSAGTETALAHIGIPRIPFVHLTPEEDGDWFFRSVEFFNGTALDPNPVTCSTCHPDNGTDGVLSSGRNIPPVWASGPTPPFGWAGNTAGLSTVVAGTFGAHGTLGGSLSPLALSDVVAFLEKRVEPPPSPFAADGLSAQELAGQSLFEGSAGCSSCHQAPHYVPLSPAPATIVGGVGTGLAPANVPSLRGLWASAPYLHDGSAETLLDVLELDTSDQHGVTSTLSAGDRDALVAYLKTL